MAMLNNQRVYSPHVFPDSIGSPFQNGATKAASWETNCEGRGPPRRRPWRVVPTYLGDAAEEKNGAEKQKSREAEQQRSRKV